MRSFIRSLSAPAEFCLVIAVGLGAGVLGATSVIVKHVMHATPRPVHFCDQLLIGLFIYELLALALVFWIGRLRAWSFPAFGFQISWKGTGGGILLYVLAVVAYSLVFQLGHFLLPAARTPVVLASGLTLPVVILNSVTNPVFEEFLEVGYIVRSLQRFGMWPAVLVSAILRGFLHAHLGISGAAGIFAFGMVFGLAYWRWRQLWPLFIGHAIADFVALFYLIHHDVS